MNNIKVIFGTLFILAFLGSCKKDDSLFDGKDNYISSFQLKQGEITLKASISPDSVIITAPESLSLSGSAAVIVLSENAKISPEPSSVTDWDSDQTFVVTAYNGTKVTYYYHVKRSVISKDGDIILLTQADVDVLAALKLSQINGSLTIGATEGKDSIYSLASLSGLKSIVYDLTINPTYAGNDLTGLENLEKTGSLQIAQVTKLKSISFPKLNAVMSDMVINQTKAGILSFPALTKVDKGLQVLFADSVVSMEFPKLQNIVENLTIQGGWNTNKLKKIDFPLLGKVGGNLIITQWSDLKSVNFPLLTKAVSLSATSLPKMETLAAPKLQSVLGDIMISYTLQLTSLDLSALQTVSGNFRLENLAIENMAGLQTLTSVGGELFLSSLPNLKSTHGLESLKTVGERLYLSDWPVLDDGSMEGFSSLNNVGGEIIISQVPFKKFTGFALTKTKSVSMFGGDGISTIQEIDVTKLDIDGTLTISNISSSFKLKGKDVFGSALRIDGSNVNLEGFKEVKSFYYYMMNSALQATQTASIKKVNGDLTLLIYNFDKFSMPNLEEVSGKFTLSASSKMDFEFPVLKKSGVMNINATQTDVISFPALQSVEGNCTIATGNYQGAVSDVQMPALTKVNGILNLSGYSSYYTNTKITNLNGFAALTDVKGITIAYNEGLVDFTGLKNAISSFSSSGWSVSDNGYNPTWQDMKDGKWVKP